MSQDSEIKLLKLFDMQKPLIKHGYENIPVQTDQFEKYFTLVDFLSEFEFYITNFINSSNMTDLQVAKYIHLSCDIQDVKELQHEYIPNILILRKKFLQLLFNLKNRTEKIIEDEINKPEKIKIGLKTIILFSDYLISEMKN
jgi:hypothetical protein